MNLIDTHAHLYVSDFDNDRKEVLDRSIAANINKILLPAIDSASHAAMLSLEQEHPSHCISMMGVHPCSIKEDYKNELKIARSYLDQRKFIAVGEIGLDFYWDKTFTDQQLEAFHQQTEWALDLDIPIAIHSRNATDECIQVVEEHQQGKLKGVFHCFSGDVNQARKIIDLGFYLGIGGVVTFKNAGLDKVIEAIGLQHLVLETDAPYLAPMPFRGKRNESSYLKYVVDKLALIFGVSEEDIANITTANAKKLFGC